MKITLLNTAILTAFGTFDFQSVSLAETREMVKNSQIEKRLKLRVWQGRIKIGTRRENSLFGLVIFNDGKDLSVETGRTSEKKSPEH